MSNLPLDDARLLEQIASSASVLVRVLAIALHQEGVLRFETLLPYVDRAIDTAATPPSLTPLEAASLRSFASFLRACEVAPPPAQDAPPGC